MKSEWESRQVVVVMSSSIFGKLEVTTFNWKEETRKTRKEEKINLKIVCCFCGWFDLKHLLRPWKSSRTFNCSEIESELIRIHIYKWLLRVSMSEGRSMRANNINKQARERANTLLVACCCLLNQRRRKEKDVWSAVACSRGALGYQLGAINVIKR